MARKRRSRREAAEAVVRHLRERGHQALFAGGCVRDLLMGSQPKDYDVATDARPEAVLQAFRKTQKVGAKFGVVLVRMDGYPFEVATFRTDLDYVDGRHPTGVEFADARQDAQRRDFTINGMFYDPVADQVIDYVGGRQDLQNGVVRAIGDPARRFAEDHLRMMRGVRFAARLSFALEPGTADAIRQEAPQIRVISAERVRTELLMILTDPSRRRGWELLCETGLTPWILPDVIRNDVQAAKIAKRLEHLPAHIGEGLALAAILRSLDPAGAAERCRALTCSNHQIKRVRWLLERLPDALRCDSLEQADCRLLLAAPGFEDLMALLAAELVTENLSGGSLGCWRRWKERFTSADAAPPPLVTGDDLAMLGLAPGPRYSQLLDELYRRQLNEDLTGREDALAAARGMIRKADG